MVLYREARLLPTNAFEVLCSRSAQDGVKDSVSHAKYGSASLRHRKCCPPLPCALPISPTCSSRRAGRGLLED